MAETFGLWDESKHPRGWHGRFGAALDEAHTQKLVSEKKRGSTVGAITGGGLGKLHKAEEKAAKMANGASVDDLAKHAGHPAFGRVITTARVKGMPSANALEAAYEQHRLSRPAGGSYDDSFAWNSAAHPRASKGTPTGGQFVSASSSSQEKNAAQKKLGKGGDFTAAVKAYQAAHGLQVDGVIGHQTASALQGKKGEKVGALTAADHKFVTGKGKAKRRSGGHRRKRKHEYWPDAETFRDFSAEKRRELAKQGKAMPDGSFPIENEEDVKSAVHLARTPAQRAHVRKRAKAVGASQAIPEGWPTSSDTTKVMDAVAAQAEVWAAGEALGFDKGVPETHPEERDQLNISPKKNWVEKRGGLPSYINSVAVALVRKGTPREHAIPIAINTVKKTCATGLWGGHPKAKVSDAIKSAACKAAAEWEAKKATASEPVSADTILASGSRDALEALTQADFDELEDEFVEMLSIAGELSDSRGGDMDEDTLTTLATTFGLEGEVTEEQILEQAQSLVETHANSHVLTADEFSTLKASAERGEQAAKTLDERDRDETFLTALRAGKVGDAARETFNSLWESNRESAKAFLEAIPAQVSTHSNGASPEAGAAGTENPPADVDERSWRIAERAKQLMSENEGMSFEDAGLRAEREVPA